MQTALMIVTCVGAAVLTVTIIVDIIVNVITLKKRNSGENVDGVENK